MRIPRFHMVSCVVALVVAAPVTAQPVAEDDNLEQPASANPPASDAAPTATPPQSRNGNPGAEWQPPPPPPPPTPPEGQESPDARRNVSAAEVENAPKPTDASGQTISEDEVNKPWLWTRRVLFFIPNWSWKIVAAPIRGGLWLYERYSLNTRLKQFFFTEDLLMGVFPIASFEAGFGLSGGAQFQHKSLFGHQENLNIRALFGGRFNQNYSMDFRTGQAFGDYFQLFADVRYDSARNNLFSGIGNTELVENPMPGDPLINPYQDPSAIQTRYVFEEFATGVAGEFYKLNPFSIRLESRLVLRDYDPDGTNDQINMPIDDFYDTDTLVGYNEGLSFVYNQVQLVIDQRKIASPYLDLAVPSSGWRAQGYLGYTKGFGDDPSDFFRYAVGFEKWFDLYAGDRVLNLRAFAEGVTGTLREVPFDLLPSLGGPQFLRGYNRDRFRDRSVGLVTAEYQYPLVSNFSGFVFLDAGQSLNDIENILDVDELRFGYGLGMQVQQAGEVVVRTFVASSSDGGFFFNFVFGGPFNVSNRQQQL